MSVGKTLVSWKERPIPSRVRAAAPRRTHEPLPRTVGTWELVTPLGEGRMARVYQARPIGAQADQAAGYAVKLLREPWLDHPQALEMLRREAWVGSKISHPHLVPVLAATGLYEVAYAVFAAVGVVLGVALS